MLFDILQERRAYRHYYYTGYIYDDDDGEMG